MGNPGVTKVGASSYSPGALGWGFSITVTITSEEKEINIKNIRVIKGE